MRRGKAIYLQSRITFNAITRTKYARMVLARKHYKDRIRKFCEEDYEERKRRLRYTKTRTELALICLTFALGISLLIGIVVIIAEKIL